MSLHAIAHLHGLLVEGVARGAAARGLNIGGFQLRANLQDMAILWVIVLAPLAVWLVKLWMDRREATQRREDARAFAIDVAVTLSRSIQLCDSVRASIQTTGPPPRDTVEAALASLDLSRRKLRGYLGRRIPLHELIPLAAAAEESLTDGCQAMLTLNGASSPAAEPDPTYASRLQAVRAELQSVADRLRGLEPDLGRALAKVEAGLAIAD